MYLMSQKVVSTLENMNVEELRDLLRDTLKKEEAMRIKLSSQDAKIKALEQELKKSKEVRGYALKESEKILDDAKRNADRIVNESLIRAEKVEMESFLLRKNIDILKDKLKKAIDEKILDVESK